MSVRDTSELRVTTLEIAQIDELLRSGAEPPEMIHVDRGGDRATSLAAYGGVGPHWRPPFLGRRRGSGELLGRVRLLYASDLDSGGDVEWLAQTPAATTCGHSLIAAPPGDRPAWVEINCEALPCPCLRPGEGGGGGSDRPRRRREPRRRVEVISARITAVVDGDTVKVRSTSGRRRSYTIRLIGIDTPEARKPGTPVECGGPEASDNMRSMAFHNGEGRRVTVTTDPSQDRTDRFGRLLAYVATSDGAQLNVSQVAAGWSRTYVFRKRFRQYSRFKSAERRARSEDRGVWAYATATFTGGSPPSARGTRGLRRVRRKHKRASREKATTSDSSAKPGASRHRACEDNDDDFIGTCTDEGSVYHLLRKRDTAELKELEVNIESVDVEERANGVATVTVKLTITNRTAEPQSVNATGQVGLLLTDKQYSPVEDSFVDVVQPDLSQTGTVTFEAPDRLAAKISDPKTNGVLAVLNFSEFGAGGASEYAYFLLGR